MILVLRLKYFRLKVQKPRVHFCLLAFFITTSASGWFCVENKEVNMLDSGNKDKRLSPNDPNSYSRPEECCVTDLIMELSVDFATKTIKGTAEYACQRKEVGADVIVSFKFNPSAFVRQVA